MDPIITFFPLIDTVMYTDVTGHCVITHNVIMKKFFIPNLYWPRVPPWFWWSECVKARICLMLCDESINPSIFTTEAVTGRGGSQWLAGWAKSCILIGWKRPVKYLFTRMLQWYSAIVAQCAIHYLYCCNE